MSLALLAPGLASCLADVREAAALPCTEVPLRVSLGRGQPQGPARQGVPSPLHEEAVGGGGCLQAMPAQVLTPCVPSLCAPPRSDP